MKLQKKHGDLLLGIIILAFGAFYLIGCSQITIKESDALHSAFVPYFIGCMLLVVSALQLWRGLSELRNPNADTTPMGAGVDFKTMFITMALLIIYIAMLAPLGYILASSLYLFLQFVILTPDEEKKRFVLYAVIAVISGIGVFLIFRYGLDLMLPQGIVKFI